MAPVLSPDHLALYHSHLPLHSVAWGLLIDFAVIAVFGALVFAYLEKSRRGRLHPAWAAVGVCVALAMTALFLVVLQRPEYHRYLIRAGGITLVLTLLSRWFWPRIYRAYSRSLMVLFLLAGFSAIWILPELAWLSLAQARPTAGDFFRAEAATDPSRIVWILFDELSYDQTFGRGHSAVNMPAFRDLARTSVVFSDLQPTGYYTQLVVPSLFLGDKVVALKSDMEGMPRLKFAGKKGWRRFRANEAVFAKAQKQGWSTGVVGWYNPYCRILAGSLNSCYASVSDLEPNGMSPANSALKNALLPVETRLGKFFRKPESVSQEHEADFTNILEQTRTAIADEDVRFLFVHLPIPHPPGIYDRATGQLRPGGDYLDNLALSDRTLGELLTLLSRTPSWRRTTLVICSDHSWRVPMWRQWPSWTAEEEEASRGVFDPRPVLMIHFPSESNGMVVATPFAELRLHEILLKMIQGRMDTRKEFSAWLSGDSESASRPLISARSGR